MESRAKANGRIVIPAPLRRKYGIRKGTRIRIVDEGNRIVLRPITPDYIRKLRGLLKGGGGLKALAEDRRREKEIG